MPIARCLAALILAAVLSMPAVGHAQATTSTIPRGPGSSEPPVELSGGDDGSDRSGSPAPRRSSKLPNTGSDPRKLILAGVVLTLLGVGLRLRTADADLY